jgi:segregation and condensation protein B
METLSIIAFKQPITKIEIENIRGVKIDRVLATLNERQMIKEIGRKETIGRPILYGTTENFLKCFGLNGLQDLPPLAELLP